MERSLAAILAADVVGYSTMMGANFEAGRIASDANVGCCAGFSDAASRRLSGARCLPASEKRQGTKLRGQCADGSGSAMGNRRRRGGCRVNLSGGCRGIWSCGAPVLIAHPDAASIVSVFFAPG